MYCRNCGQRLDDQAKFCPVCGAVQSVPETNLQPDPIQYAQPPVADKGGFLWGLLGCCIPIAGLVLYLTWQSQRPKTAKAALIGAAVGAVLFALLYVLGTVLGIVIGLSLVEQFPAVGV